MSVPVDAALNGLLPVSLLVCSIRVGMECHPTDQVPACLPLLRLVHIDERDRPTRHVRQLAIPFLDRQPLVFHLAQADQFRRHLLALDRQQFGFGPGLGHALAGFDFDARQVAFGCEFQLRGRGPGSNRFVERLLKIHDRKLVHHDGVARQSLA